MTDLLFGQLLGISRRLGGVLGLCLLLVTGFVAPQVAQAQDQALAQQPGDGAPLVFSTVDRPPFAMGQSDQEGFSIELMRLLAEEMGREVRFETAPSFAEMLGRVEAGDVDGAIANISITAAREEVLDFTLPIFQSGLQIMALDTPTVPFWRQILTMEVAAYLALAAAVLFAGGMLMWVFERKVQPYFQYPARQAMFPAFWWALNLVLNGGFEERMPRSPLGRIFGVLMVIISLFFVSVFVARITAAMTVTALTTSVSGLNDLDNRRVGTVLGSTAAGLLDAREIRFAGYEGFGEVIAAFEAREVDVVVFDGPLLQYYLFQTPDSGAHLIDRVFRAEDYGIALPTLSPLREPLNQALLTLRENGSYNALVEAWFSER